MAEFDKVIKGGMVIDGSRGPRYLSDVAIKDGKIAEIGHIDEHRAAEVLDADAFTRFDEAGVLSSEVGRPLLPNVTEPDPVQASIFSIEGGCGDNDRRRRHRRGRGSGRRDRAAS